MNVEGFFRVLNSDFSLPFHLSLLVSLVHQEDLVFLVDLEGPRFLSFLVGLCHLEVPSDQVVQIDPSSQAFQVAQEVRVLLGIQVIQACPGFLAFL